MKLTVKTVSSLEKCFLDEDINKKREISSLSALCGETLSFQIAYYNEISDNPNDTLCYLKVSSPISNIVKVSKIESVPVRFATYANCTDKNYLRKTPGLYPDLLIPMNSDYELHIPAHHLGSLWVDVEIPSGFRGGEYPISFAFTSEKDGKGRAFAEVTFDLKIISADLREQDLTFAQWMHCDCLADHYRVDIFSERHWEIIENYVRCAVKNGINAIFTPIFTPPLDTPAGKERPTVQLIEVFEKSGKWGFNFSRLDRWLDMCERCGVKYFEISHLFTQQGATHAPKIMGWKDGKYQKLFGWETNASSDEYAGFLRAFLRRFIDHMKKKGLDQRCIFHISDEPRDRHFDDYATAKSIVADLLDTYHVADALSSVNFYKTGLVERPIPSIDFIEDFIEANVPDLWTYYCCAQYNDVPNRFIAMPLSRTRIVGAQFYKYSVVGFLHWGYNFWYTMTSQQLCDPYLTTDVGRVPAGDAYSVYPAADGTPYESIRLRSFYEAICDLRALKLCEKLCGREAVLEAIASVFPEPFDFKNYPSDGIYILALRHKINSMIEEKI
jgi:hypothetical protein